MISHIEGPDKRKWREALDAAPCKVCGKTPIAARSLAGWSLQCPVDEHHGYHYEQWLQKCIRKWNKHQRGA